MNQKEIDRLIPIVLKMLEEKSVDIFKEDGKTIKSAYSSYLASFGPAIRQAGMLKALAFYTIEGSQADRIKIAILIQQLLQKSGVIEKQYQQEYLLETYIEMTRGKSKLDILDLDDRILEAITACKLATATYHKEKPESEVKNAL